MLFKKFFIIFFITLSFCFAVSPLTVSFTMDRQNAYDFDAHLTLTNHTSQTINHWKLGFNFARLITTMNNAFVAYQNGDYYWIVGEKPLLPNRSLTLLFQANWIIKHLSDAPAGFFLIETDAKGSAIKNPVTVDVEKITFPNMSPRALKKIEKQNRQEHLGYEKKWRNTHPQSKNTSSLLGVNIIPRPVKMAYTSENHDAIFILNKNTVILNGSADNSIIQPANDLKHFLEPATGFQLTIENGIESQPNSILLTTEGVTKRLKKTLGKEGYTLSIHADRMVIRANTSAGLFYGVQTVTQLFPTALFSESVQKNIPWQVPCITIIDYPRFHYRGMMLDVVRNFRTIPTIKRFLKLMAMHKLNVFHWHLTDDEGWRIQIKKYPTLTQIGAFRGYDKALKPSLGSGHQRYGGFYTQKEIREIITYAAKRNITVIPEIDVPGHARALIQSLPNALKDPLDQSQYLSAQYYRDNILPVCVCHGEKGCPNANIDTYTVLNNIIKEVADLFPSEYIHIGSDEVPNGAWEKSPNCQFLMRQKHLSKNQLQSYFLYQLQTILKVHHKKMAGWGEIADLNDRDFPLDKSSLRLYIWRSVDAGIHAAKKGFNLIMTPAKYLYLDLAYSADPRESGYYWAGYLNTFGVYDYNPAPTTFSKKARKHIRGVQGALWAETIKSQSRLDYYMFPKLAALAEVVWTPERERNWSDFKNRLNKGYLKRLDYWGVKYKR